MARRATSPSYLSDSRSLSLNRHSIRTPLSRSHLCCQLVRSHTAYSDSERSLSRSVLKLLVSITYLSFVGRSCLEVLSQSLPPPPVSPTNSRESSRRLECGSCATLGEGAKTRALLLLLLLSRSVWSVCSQFFLQRCSLSSVNHL